MPPVKILPNRAVQAVGLRTDQVVDAGRLRRASDRLFVVEAGASPSPIVRRTVNRYWE